MGENAVKLSVIVPFYNGKSYICRCIDSILPQLDDDMELIVSDDASTDGTFEYLCGRYKDEQKLVIIKNAVNRGPAGARNAGIRMARGEWIAFCDADDAWHERRSDKLFSYIRDHGEAEIIFTGIEIVCEEETAETAWLAERLTTDKYHFYSMFCRREVFERIGLLNEEMRIREDTEWLVRARAAGLSFVFLDEPLYIRNIRPDGLSAQADESTRQERIQLAFISGIRRGRNFHQIDTDNSWTDSVFDISILVPMYNAEKYITEAVNSCRSERYSAEIVVVDDGSGDSSLDKLCKAAETCRIPLTIVKRCHKGQAASRNDSLSLSRGRCILYLDADDVFLPGAVDTLMDAAASSTDAMLISALCKDFISPELTTEEAGALQVNPDPYRRMLSGCMLARRDLFRRIGSFNENMPTSETADWVLRLRDAKEKILEINDIVLARRYHKTNLGRARRKDQMDSYVAMLRRRLKERQGAEK